MTLQKLGVEGKKSDTTWINLFDKIAFYTSRQSWLTTPKLIRLNLDKLFLALENTVQVKLIRTRWREIKTVSGFQSASCTKKLPNSGSTPILLPTHRLTNTT